jgi:hypothetical protein
MKRLLILLLAIMPLSAMAQGFQFENNTVTWQKVYDSDMTLSDIYTAMMSSNDFIDIQLLEDRIFASIKPVNYVPEDYGFRYGNSCTLLLNGALGPISIRIDVKEGRYRVTASDFCITDITPGGFTPVGYIDKLDDYAFKKGAPSKLMIDQFAPVFGKFLERKTTFTKVDDEW